MWRHFLVAIVLTAHGTLGQSQEEEDPFHAGVERLRTLARTWDAEYRDFYGRAVTKPSVGSLGTRRLQGLISGGTSSSSEGYNSRGVAAMCANAVSWVENTSASVLGRVEKALGVGEIRELFEHATKWVEKGVEEAKKAWDCMIKLGHKLLHIFNDFEPLQPIFANSSGLMSLITSQENMATLVHVVRELLNTSSTLDELGGAVHSVSEMFQEISNLFKGALGRVDEKVQPATGRRLPTVDGPKDRLLREAINYVELMQNLDFEKLVPLLFGFMHTMRQHSESLLLVQNCLSPLLQQLDAASTHPARRMMSGTGMSTHAFEKIKQDQQKFSRAIKAIIPTWQGIESTFIAMCPVVAMSDGTSGSLKCRVLKFVKEAKMPSWVGSMISGLVEGCPEPAGNSTGCPTKSHSADINDLLGQNAEIMGWVMAIIVAALGSVGVGAIFVAKKTYDKGDQDSEEEECSDE